MKYKVIDPPNKIIMIGLILISLFPLYTAYHYPPYLNDDSFITLSYVKNLVHGNGFVFNMPPATLGTTTPLLTLVVAGIASILPQADIARIAVFFTAICWAGIPWIFFLFRRQWGLKGWEIVILGLVIAGSGWIPFLGMEAYLFAFLLVLSLSLFLRQYYRLTGFTLGLLFLTRGEGAIVLCLVMAIIILQHWYKFRKFNLGWIRPVIYILFGFLIPVVLWEIYAFFTFGSLLPNTLIAKQAQGQNGTGRPFLQRLMNEWVPNWEDQFSLKQFPSINFWWILAGVGALTVIFSRRNWLLFIGWVAAYIAGYTILGVSAYSWYQLPILFVLQLLFSLGIIKCIEIIGQYVTSKWLFAGLSLFLVIISIYTLFLPTITFAAKYQGDSRGEAYINLSQWFRENAQDDESIAYIEIGYLGYYTDNRIIDLAGLVLPDIVKHVGNGNYAWGFWHYRPDYYVYLPDFDWALGAIISDPRFENEYTPVATLDSHLENDFTIYKRR